MKWSLVKCQNINEKLDSETEHHKIPITKNSPSLSATFATLSIGDWKSFFFLLFRLLHFSVDCTRAAPTVGYMFHAPISLSTIKSASNNNKKVWKVEMKQEKKSVRITIIRKKFVWSKLDERTRTLFSSICFIIPKEQMKHSSEVRWESHLIEMKLLCFFSLFVWKII